MNGDITVRRGTIWLWIAVVFVAALALRLAFLFQFQATPLFDTHAMDMRYFHQWALEESEGRTLTSGAYFKAPLYPVFVSFVYRLFGSGPWAIRLVQVLLGSLSAVLTFLIGFRVFSLRTGIAAGLMVAACGTLILFDVQLLVPCLAICLLLVSMYCLVRGMQTHGRALYLLSGLALGLSALARQTVLLFAVVLVVYLLILSRRSSGGVNWKSTLLILAGLTIAIAPVTVRNYARTGQFVLIGAYGGINLYIGNNLKADGVSTYVPGTGLDWWADGAMDEAVRMAEADAGRPLTLSDQSAYWRDRAVREMAANPGFLARILLKKLVLVVFGFELSNNFDVYYTAHHSAIMKLLLSRSILYLPWGLLLPLAVAGMVLLVDMTTTRRVLLLFLLAYLPTLVLFFVTSRYRLPMIPFLALFAAHAIVSLRPSLRAHGRRVVLAAAAFVLMLILAHTDSYGLARTTDAQGHHMMASLYLRKGDQAQAEKYYQLALAENPYLPHANNDLAAMRMSRGEYAEAVPLLQRAIQSVPDDEIIRYNLGASLLESGHAEEASRHLGMVLKTNPGHFDAATRLGRSHLLRNQPDSALEAYRKAVTADSLAALGAYSLGYCHHLMGAADSARHYYGTTLKCDSSYLTAYYSLGILALAEGFRDSTIAYLTAFLSRAHDSSAMVFEARRIIDSLDTR